MSPNAPAVRRRDFAAMQRRALRMRPLDGPPRAERGPTRVGLWLPTTLIFLLLAPLALLLLPFLYLAPRQVLPRPAATLAAVGAVLFSLGGTTVDVDAPGAHVRLRLF